MYQHTSITEQLSIREPWQGRGRVAFDDLYQTGFLATLEAVRTFNPEKGVRFVTWLGTRLRTPFLAAEGYRTKHQQQDPMGQPPAWKRPWRAQRI